jgi:acyl carrier protein
MQKNLKKLQKIVVKNFFVQPEKIDFGTSFQKDLHFTENEFIALLVYTENTFRIEIADSDIPKLKKVRDMVKYIEREKGQ